MFACTNKQDFKYFKKMYMYFQPEKIWCLNKIPVGTLCCTTSWELLVYI